MKKPKIKSWGLLALATPILVTFAGLELAKAQSTPELLISIEFSGSKRPPSGGTSGGGTRGSCLPPEVNTQEKKGLTALIPREIDEDGNVTIFAETTSSTQPKFFLYVPENNSKELAQFIVNEKSGQSEQNLYSADIKISGYSGSIVELTLPQNVNLEANKEYTWSFNIICDPQDRSVDVSVEGTIKKVDISSELENQLKNASPLEKAKIYAEAEIWHDTIEAVADVRNSDHAEWEELLKSVGLEDFVDDSIFEIKPAVE
ncbi:MAG: DUF928 domain-containing protein [Trichodesmium sp. MAG_R04]|nr:DUF928 domain-containing protein [Trichodesmium sp. MAG_R04]